MKQSYSIALMLVASAAFAGNDAVTSPDGSISIRIEVNIERRFGKMEPR